MHTELAPAVCAAVKTVLSSHSFALLNRNTGNGAFLCINDVVVDLPCRKDASKVFFREVNTNILSKSRYNVDLILVMYYISAGQTSLLQVQ